MAPGQYFPSGVHWNELRLELLVYVHSIVETNAPVPSSKLIDRVGHVKFETVLQEMCTVLVRHAYAESKGKRAIGKVGTGVGTFGTFDGTIVGRLEESAKSLKNAREGVKHKNPHISVREL